MVSSVLASIPLYNMFIIIMHDMSVHCRGLDIFTHWPAHTIPMLGVLCIGMCLSDFSL